MSIIGYSKPACTYCDKAKALLKRLGHQYTEKVVTINYYRHISPLI
jgi:glutaredoxin